jgi:hypothetical protein
MDHMATKYVGILTAPIARPHKNYPNLKIGHLATLSYLEKNGNSGCRVPKWIKGHHFIV